MNKIIVKNCDSCPFYCNEWSVCDAPMGRVAGQIPYKKTLEPKEKINGCPLLTYEFFITGKL